jgi:hypothetical protein
MVRQRCSTSRAHTTAQVRGAERRRLNALNRGIGTLARERSFLLGGLERLFHGHGVASDEPWFVQVIEPNLASTSAIAEQRNPLWVIDVTNDAIRLRR